MDEGGQRDCRGVGGTVEDLAYDALERYLSADGEEEEDATEAQQDRDRSEDEAAPHDEVDEDEESDVDAA